MNVQSSKNAESKSENSNAHENLRAHVVSTGDLQVAAVFPSKLKVQEVLEIVQDQTSVEVSQVEIIEAGDPKMSVHARDQQPPRHAAQSFLQVVVAFLVRMMLVLPIGEGVAGHRNRRQAEIGGDLSDCGP